MTRSHLAKLAAAVGLLLIGYQLACAVGPAKEAEHAGGQESLDVRYAQAQVALAEANLKRLREMNQKVAGSVSADTLVSFERDANVARAVLRAAQSGADADEFDVWLRRADADVGYSAVQWRGAVAANRRVAGVISPTDVERRRLRLEMNRLELQRGQALVHAAADRKLAWQLSLINNEMQQLKDEVRQTVPTAPLYPSWLR